MEKNNLSTVLVTGAAGFIGYHMSKLILGDGIRTVGFDNLNDYYDVNLKQSRLDILQQYDNFEFIKGDLTDKQTLGELFTRFKPQVVVHLAAQAGVRYSIENPLAYIDSNILGFVNILEACRSNQTGHLIFASSSSVYGNLNNTPFTVGDNVNLPISLYAATKTSNELMAHTYSHLYDIPVTGLRFFTVYGEYGRPDMAYFSFAEKIMNNKPIRVFNNGDLYRDFTYIDDITAVIRRMLSSPPKTGATGGTTAKFKVYNIGGGQSENLLYFIEVLENVLGKKSIKEFCPMQPGDVYKTFADTKDLETDFGIVPKIRIEEGLKRFANWYKEYRKGR
ncbi:MAG: GDP-mannose 4,6-dehydratase [Oscillospiraceae bacterium]|nr:GDP-mannose 4,6-dehydratase [Oscillospiraceae bacterium]